MMDLEYYEWLCARIGLFSPEYNCYSKLIDILFHTDFEYVIPMDENREIDGLQLRKEWADEVGAVGDLFDGKPCSVLEMLTALSIRVEEDVMGDPGLMIFWRFLWNIGLQWADDEALSHSSEVREVGNVLEEWMEGSRSVTEYYNDGREIWEQVMNWLSERFM